MLKYWVEKPMTRSGLEVGFYSINLSGVCFFNIEIDQLRPGDTMNFEEFPKLF